MGACEFRFLNSAVWVGMKAGRVPRVPGVWLLDKWLAVSSPPDQCFAGSYVDYSDRENSRRWVLECEPELYSRTLARPRSTARTGRCCRWHQDLAVSLAFPTSDYRLDDES